MSKNSKIIAIIFGILMVIGGISCMFTPMLWALGGLGYVVGFPMIYDSIGRFVEWYDLRKTQEADGFMLAGAILSMVLGFFIVTSWTPRFIGNLLIMYLAAIWFILRGIITVRSAWKLREFHKNRNTMALGTKWYITLILGILVVIFGIICLFEPLIWASTICKIIGLGIIAEGATLITAGASPSGNQ